VASLSESEDRVLIAEAQNRTAARNRSAEAFSELHRRYKSLVFKKINAQEWHRGLADEIAASIWSKIWFGLPKFRGEANFQTWLRVVAANAISDHVRKAVRRPTEKYVEERPARYRLGDLPERGGERGPFLESLAVVGTDEDVRLEERRKEVREAVARLPGAEERMIVQRFWDGMTGREIAADHSLTEAAVRKRISRAYERLRDDLWEEDEKG